MNKQLTVATGSIQDAAEKQNQSLADALLDMKLILICDRSSSMDTRDAEGGKARYQIEDEIVARLQKQNPGKVLLISFESNAEIRYDGILPFPDGGTHMLPALELAKPLAIDDVQVFVISDGEPIESTRELCDYVRQNFTGRLNTAYAGPFGSPGYEVMLAIAAAARGQCSMDALNKNVQQLESKLQLLLAAKNGK